MSKASSRILLIVSLFAVSLWAGCGVSSTSLPSNLQPNGGPALSILTTDLPDAIQGRSYYLQIATTGGSGDIKGCTVTSGALPTGLGWSINPLQLNICILLGTVTGSPGSYSIVVEATDSSGKTAQLPYTLVVRNDFSICAGPSSAVAGCTASSPAANVTSFPAAVQGRSYGLSPLSEVVAANLNGTADASPSGHPGEFGNGPFSAASSVTGLPLGIISTVMPGQSAFAISGTEAGSPNSYTVTVTITDSPITVSTQSSPVVPARTLVKTYTQTVLPPIQLAQSLGTQWPDAVNGRAYGGAVPGCANGSACASVVYTASNGLGNYVWPATTPASISAITGMNCAASGSTYSCSATKITAGSSTPGGASTTFSPSLTVTDTGNTATPGATAASDPQSTLTDTLVVDAPLGAALTQATVPGTNPASLLPAVVNRSYGVIGAPPTYAAAGGLGAGTLGPSAYEWCLKAGSTPPPAGLGPGAASITTTCPTYVATGASLLLTASSITGSAGTYNFTMQLDDTGNTSTPASASSSTSSLAATTSLPVNSALVATVTQTGNATPAAKILDGVVNRSYGIINGGSGAPVYSASGGLASGGAYLWCVMPGSTLPGGFAGISSSCGATTSTSASSLKLAASSITGSPATYSFRVQADDGGNAAVPSTFAIPAAGSVVGPTALTVHPQVAVSLNFAPPPDAVAGRTYGSPARTDLIYTVPSGEGLAPITMTGAGFPSPITCPTTQGTQQLNCNSGNAAVTGVTTAGTVTATDTANAATPAATIATDPNSQRTADTVNVRAALTLTAPSGTLATAVAGRSWGQGNSCGATGNLACAPAVYSVANGLGGYSPGPVSAGPLACTFTSTGTFSGTYSCSTASEAAAPPSAVLALTVSDSANATTPSGSAADNSQTLAINSALTITPPSLVPTAVTGRSYGSAASGCSGGACATLNYAVSGGLGLYPASAVMTTAAGTFSCSLNGSSYQCSSTGIAGAGGTAPVLNLSVTEAANASTPGGGASDNSKTLPINSEMTLTLPATFPPAVLGRHYGVATDTTCGASGTSACLPLTYTVPSNTPGVGGPYTFTPNNFPSGFACVASSNSGNCSANPVGGTAGTLANLNVTVSDTGNASTPSNSITSANSAMTVDAEMTITPPATLAEAIPGRHYGVSTDTTCGAAANTACAPLTYTVPTATPGLGGYTFTPNNFPSGFTCTTSTNNGNCSASPVSAATAAGTLTNLNVTVRDTANASTPFNSVTSANSSLTVGTEMTLTPPSTVAAAVAGRSYGVASTCGGTGATPCAALTYTVPSTAPGLGGPYTFAPNNFPTGFTCATNSNTGNCSANPVSSAAAAGTFTNLNVTVKDVGNASTPQGAVNSTPNTTLTVDAEMTLTPPGSVPPAVLARSYGLSSVTTCGASGTVACAPLVYTVPTTTPGLGGYSFTPNNFPSGFTCATSTNNGDCSTGSVGGTAGTLSTLNVTVKDTANASTPANSVTSSNSTMTVDPEMTITPPSSIANAVAGRSYGVGSACGSGGTTACAALTYTVPSTTPGLGGPYVFTPNNFPSGFTCTTSTNNGNCSANPISASAAGTFSNLTVTVKDTANTATPGNTVTSTASTITVNPEMNFTTTPSSFANAVNGRTYGQGNTCGASGTAACAVPSYTIQTASGLGGYTYSFVVGSGSGGFTCTAGSTTSNCSSASVTASAGSYSTVHASVADTANASTPSNSVASPNGSLTVLSELTITPPSTIPAAVAGRTYGQGSTCGTGGTTACATLNYGISNGLGNYVSPASMTTTAGTFSCPLSVATYQCSSSSITASGSVSLSLTASETGNASTPGNSKSGGTQTLTVNPEMNFTATPSSLATAVNGRSYGSGSNCGTTGTTSCAPLTYTIQSGSGLGGYSYTLNLSGGNGGFSCSSGSNSTNCTSSGVTEAAGTYSSVHASVTDTANAATPANTITSSNTSLTVNAALALTPPSSYPDYPDGENNVTYGSAATGCTGGACTPLTFTVPYTGSTISGLPAYNFTESGFPTNLGCTQSSAGSPAPSGTIYTCEASTGISATGTLPQTFYPTVEVTDTANASVPAGSVALTTSGTGGLIVEPQLSILDTVLPNGLVGFVYNPSGSGVTIKSQGGIGTVAWVGPGGSATGACAALSKGTLPGTTAMTFNPASQVFSTGGTAFAAGDASTTPYEFQVCVTDTGNTATPQTAALPNPGAAAPLVANNFVFDVFPTIAYTAETTTNAVDIINTTTNTVAASAISLGATPTSNPNGVAFSPDGSLAYVTLTNGSFAVINTLTSAQITGSPFSMPSGSTCTSLAGVAVTNDGRAYFACPTTTGSGGAVDVIETSNNTTLVTEIATGDGPSGVAVSPTVDSTTGKTLQVYVTLNGANQLAIINNTATPALAGTPLNLTSTNGSPLGLAAVENPSGDVYVYIAKNASGTGTDYAGVDIVDATTATLKTPIPFTSLTQLPVGVAASPDGTEVYVTLTDSSGPGGYVWVVDNTNPPAFRSTTPYALPNPASTAADTGPIGIAIPPLASTPANGFYIYLAQSLAHNVSVLQDNPPPPNTNLPTAKTAITLNGTNPAPEGIANIPLPAVPPGLP